MCRYHLLYSFYRLCFFFFFSSRRRHTILQGDWSSDVCSSDLGARTRRNWRLDRRKRGFDLATMRLEPRWQYEMFSQRCGIFVDGEARSVGSNLKQNATRLEKID